MSTQDAADRVPYQGSVEQLDNAARLAYEQHFARFEKTSESDNFVDGARWQRYRDAEKREALERLLESGKCNTCGGSRTAPKPDAALDALAEACIREAAMAMRKHLLPRISWDDENPCNACDGEIRKAIAPLVARCAAGEAELTLLQELERGVSEICFYKLHLPNPGATCIACHGKSDDATKPFEDWMHDNSDDVGSECLCPVVVIQRAQEQLDTLRASRAGGGAAQKGGEL